MKKILSLDSIRVLSREELKLISAGYIYYKCKDGGGSGSSSTASLAEGNAVASKNCKGGYVLFEF